MFRDDDEVKFAERCKDRVSTHLHSLRMLLNDAEASGSRAGAGASLVIPHDIHLLARDVVCQCITFVEACDELIVLSEKLKKATGNPSAIREAVVGRSNHRSLVSATLSPSPTVRKTQRASTPSASSPSPSTFAETSRPGSRIAACSPCSSSSMMMTKTRIPDFHKSHVPVEIFTLNHDKMENFSSSRTRAATPNHFQHQPDISIRRRRRIQQQEEHQQQNGNLVPQLATEKIEDDDDDNNNNDNNNNSSNDYNNESVTSFLPYGDAHTEYSRRVVVDNVQYRQQRSTAVAVCRAPSPHSGEYLVGTDRLPPRQRSNIERAVKSMITSRPELSDEDRLWLVASLRRLKIDDELSNPF